MTDRLTFRVPELHYPNFYEPAYRNPMEGEGSETYGAMLAQEDVPQELIDHLGHANWVNQVGGPAYRLFGRIRPAVIADRDISTILSCTTASNLSRDRLLRGIPAVVAVIPYESSTGNPRTMVKKAALAAIRVTYDDLSRRYDEICGEFFADPSYPYNPARRKDEQDD